MTPLFAQSAAAGAESTRVLWRLESHWPVAPWLAVLAGVATVALVAWCYRRELSPAGSGTRLGLAALRIATMGLLALMLSELLLTGARLGRPRLAVVLDTSGSMGVVDPPEESIAGSEAAALLARWGVENPTRLDLARASLAAGRRPLLESLAEDFDLQVYTAAGGVETAPGAEGWAENLDAVGPDSDAPETRLGDALLGLVSPSGGAPLQGVLVVTDGRVTGGAPLAAAAESARRAGAPLYFLGVGSRRAPPDVALADLLAEEVVFVDDLVNFRATLRASGAGAGTLRVTLRREGEEAVLAEQLVTPADGGSPVQLIYSPPEPGRYRFVLAAETIEGELDAGNNTLTHELQVRDARVRVLLVAGYPNYEYRYLKHLLERDKTADLRVYLQEADAEYAEIDPSAVNRLPTDAGGFEAFDVVVLIDPDPRLVARPFWEGLREFVSRGGGLAMTAGPRSLPSAYAGVEGFDELLPVVSAGAIGVRDAGFRLRPTPQGLRSAGMQLAADPTRADEVWRGLPELYWYAELGAPKPAARVLAEHPTAELADGSPAPLVVSQYFGAGRVLLHGVDSTYRWRAGLGEALFARYWVQSLRTLARGRLVSGGGVELAADRQRYEAGEAVRLRLRVRGASPAAIGDGVGVLVQSPGGEQRRVTLAPLAEAAGVYAATLERLPVGRYRALLTDAEGTGEPVTASFEVVAPPGEFARLAMDVQAMRAAAERSGGAFFTRDKLDELAAALPAARRPPIETLPPVELWNRWWMLAAVCGCLITEWILRKRASML